MTPQERQLVDDLFDRLARLENSPRDPNASAVIAEGLRKAPNAVYAMVQTVLLQDEALKRASARIEELETAQAPRQEQSSGGFLDSMRATVFGSAPQGRGSVPNVPPPESRPVWNSGQAMQQAQSPGPAQPGYGMPPVGQSFGAPPFGGGGSSFLGTAAAAAAGTIGGSLLLGGIRNMMGGSRFGLANPTTAVEADRPNPWSDQSGSTLARDAGVGDIGSSRDNDDDPSRSGLIDQASNDQNDPNDQTDHGSDHDDMDTDADDFTDNDDDFGNDDGSDYA
jgi:uncharacterized protein